MIDNLEGYAKSPIERLRSAVLLRALGVVAVTDRTAKRDALGLSEILHVTETGGIDRFKIMTFVEGAWWDDLVQVSFDTDEISEAHLVIAEDAMRYEECRFDDASIPEGPVDDELATRLLVILDPLLGQL